MRKSISTFLKVACLIMVSNACFAKNIYVKPSPTGSDKNAGTISAPYATLQKAHDMSVAGDTIFMRDGVFTAQLAITKSGTASQYITYKAYPGEYPKLFISGNIWNAITVNGSYTVIDGLELQGNNANLTYTAAYAAYTTALAGGAASGIYNTNGISIGGPNTDSKLPHHIIIRNCKVHDFPGGGISSIQADYATIEGNTVYNNAWYMMYAGSGISILNPINSDAADTTKYKNIVRNNYVYGNKTTIPWIRLVPAKLSDGNGIIIDVNQYPYGGSGDVGPRYTGRTLVENNISFNNGGSGIHSYKADHVDIRNNTAYGNGTMVGYPDIYTKSATDVNITNNIMYARDSGKCNDTKTIGTTVKYDYNLYYNGTVGFMGTHDKVGNPQFVRLSTDGALANFYLSSSSSAIDAGSNTAGEFAVTDFSKKARPVGARSDMGAYEYVGSVPKLLSSFTGAIAAFATTYGTASAAQSFTVAGTSLTGNITATAPAGFEVSADGITYATTVTYTQNGGTASGNISIRLAALAPAAGLYNAKAITLTSTGAEAFAITTLATGNTITPKSLTASTTVAPKVYDGTTAAVPITIGAVSGLLGADQLTITATGVYYSSGAGTRGITISYALANGTGVASNYSMANFSTTVVINKKPLTAATTLATRVYDGTKTLGTLTLGAISGLVGTETLNITATAGAYSSANAGTQNSEITYTLADGVGGLVVNYSMASFTAVQIITPKVLTASSSVASKVYDGTAAAGTVSLGTVSGLLGSETLVITPTADVYSSANVGVQSATITYALANGTNGGLAANYSMANKLASGNITIRSVTVTPAVGQSKTAGEADPSFTYTASPALLSPNVFTGALSRSAGDAVGTYAYSIGTLSAGYNYTILFGGSNTFAVNVNPCVSPVITSQPAVAQTLCKNAAITNLTLTASGSGLLYQWYSNTSNSNNGGAIITGATSATFTPPNNTVSKLYYYCAVIGNCKTISSATAAVTVNAPSVSSQTITACNSYTWRPVTTYTTSGVYTYSTTNAAGCDSVATLNLVINQAATASFTAVACDAYALPWGDMATTTGDYSHHYSTLLGGCDSLVTFHLTINQSTQSLLNIINCGSYTWSAADGSQLTYTHSGDYTYTSTNSTGCTNVATLHLIIQQASATTTTLDICPADTATFTWSGKHYGAAGTYIEHFNNVDNCDSTATLHLTVSLFSVDAIAGPSITCAKSSPTPLTSTNLATYTVSANNAASYFWTIPNEAVLRSGQGTNTITVAYASSFVADSVTVNVTSHCGETFTRALAVSNFPAAPTAIDNARCGPGEISLSAAPATGQTIDWYSAATGGTLLSSGSLSYSTPAITTATYFYAASRSIATGCVSTSRAAVLASLNTFPSAPAVVTGAAVCVGATATISATPLPGTTISWYASSRLGVALASASSNFNTPAITKATSFYAQSTNIATGCVSALRTAVAVTTSALPAPPAVVKGAAKCGAGVATISATPSSGTTIDWYAAPTGGAALSSGVNYTTPTAVSSTTTYYAGSITTATGCVSATRKAVAVVINTVPQAPAVASTPICGAGKATLSATPAAGETIDWYNASTGGTLLKATAPAYAITKISETASFFAAARNTTTGCPSERTVLVQTVNVLPATPIGSGAAVCGQGVATISASPKAAGETIDWYSLAKAGVLLQNASTTYILPSTILKTTPYFAQARNTTTGCVSAIRAAVSVAVNVIPSVPSVVKGAAKCGTDTVTISATPLLGTTIDWYAAASGGVALSSGVNYTTPIALSKSATYYAASRNTTTACVSATRKEVLVTINTVPDAPVASASLICGGGKAVLTGMPSVDGTIDWYAASTGGTALKASSPSYAIANITATTSYYAVSRILSTNCVSSRTLVEATVNALPAEPTATGASRCGAGSINLSATAGSTETIDWFAAATAGTALATNAATFSPSIIRTTTYYAEAKSRAGCASATRAAAIATVATNCARSLTADKKLSAVTTASMRVYPNPNRGVFTISISTKEKAVYANIQILNGFGKLIHQVRAAVNSDGTLLVPMSVRGIAAGIYQAQYTIGKETGNVKVMIAQ